MLSSARESLKLLECELHDIENSTEENYFKIVKCHDTSKRYCEQILQKVINYEFKDLNEQIEFFKIIKPNLFSHLFYYSKIKNIESKCLGNSQVFRKVVLIEELSKKVNFFDCYNELYTYYKNDSKDCDNKYFSKFDSVEIKHIGKGCEEIMLSSQDIIFAKFKAYENVEKYLVDELQRIVYSDCLPEKTEILSKLKGLGIQWTGSDRDLVELIYGLSMYKCFNSGNIKLTRIFEGMKMIFNLSMSIEDFYNIGSQVRNRKKANEISFFEKLKAAMSTESGNFKI